MKFVPTYTTVILLALAGCDNNSNSFKTTGSNNYTGEPDCPKNNSFHVDQKCDLLPKISTGKQGEVFKFAFEKGDELFDKMFTTAEGGGANVGGKSMSHYTSMPRADLKGVGQWGKHFPKRSTGPNAQSCKECHATPAEDGAGRTALNVHRDPNHACSKPVIGDSESERCEKSIIQRNTPHLFGQGAMQLLAEEMTADLRAIYDKTVEKACASPTKQAEEYLITKDINFGKLILSCAKGKVAKEDAKIEATGSKKAIGIASDLVVRPFEWKKSVAFVRDFTRGASHNEIGMQATEIVGIDKDGDGDGKENELTVGDLTAFTVYMAAQPRPTTKMELSENGLLETKLSKDELSEIDRGEKLFGEEGANCSSCHKPVLTLKNTIFREPSKSEFHRDDKKNTLVENKVVLDMKAEGVTPDKAITFDLTKDIPDNILKIDGQEKHLGNFIKNKQGGADVELYSDLMRHYMGDELAESIVEPETGLMGMVPYEHKNALVNYYEDEKSEKEEKATFGTKELWGVACTGPWLHDGRATTLHEAIIWHGGEAEASKKAYESFNASEKRDLIAFLGNQVLYMKKAEDTEIPKLSEDCYLQELQ